MSIIQERILTANARNLTLLKTLTETDYVAGALQQNGQFVASLTANIADQTKAVKTLSLTVSKEQADHEKYRDSTMKRLAFKLSGKKEAFAARAEKEEKEYFEAIQKRFNAQRYLESLQTTLADAQATRKELEQAASVHRDAQSQLDSLYESIFAGQTPDFPEEDAKEFPVREAAMQLQAAQMRLGVESQVRMILVSADEVMRGLLRDLDQAESASEMDMWGLGGTYADVAERSALANAQGKASRVRMLVAQARNLHSGVGSVGPMTIAEGNWMSDVLFDNVFSDMKFHDKIMDSVQQCRGVHAQVVGETKKAIERENAARQEAGRATAKLEAARRELQDVRRSVFERLAGGLPTYDQVKA
jgi:hypothetical protein